ncbi:hypothetical protein OPV22_027288 [Ensete ventricosum]|uniref:Uncharacterized protein n=1 Tax=Ensete ventricosum TaxID=4639 RepID=A0AAV8Q5D1_ENSVE|nr:hypothetical protein OPV22_027288 [Ensete ventricosum]
MNGRSSDMGPPSSAKNDRGESGACLVDEFRLRVLVSKHLLVQARLMQLAHGEATAPARGIIDGKAIDQGVAYALMLVALLVTYILH